MGNSQEKSNKKFKNALQVISKMSVRNTKQFEDWFYKCNTNEIQQVSSPLHLKEKIKEYVNTQMIQTLSSFEKKYSLYREVRGDGNCFYRSVFFLYLEYLIILYQTNPSEVEKRIEQLVSMATDLEKIVIKSTIPLELEKFLTHVTKFFNCGIYQIQLDIIQNKSIPNTNDKILQLQKFMNTYPIFDFSSILLMRKIALRGYDKFKTEMAAFYLGNEVQTIKDYSMEGQNCIMKLISEYLQIPIQIENVQREFVNTVLFTPEFTKIEENNTFPTLYLFFRPGHYDICYPIDYANTVYFRRKLQSQAESIIPQQQISSQIKNDQPLQLVKHVSKDYSLNDNCFFCNSFIPMLINEMRICQECYNKKIGQDAPNNKCKICEQNNDDTTRPYCLCQHCEVEYLDFGDNQLDNIRQSSQLKSKMQQVQNPVKKNTPTTSTEDLNKPLNNENAQNNIILINQDNQGIQQIPLVIQDKEDLCIVDSINNKTIVSSRQSTLLQDNLNGICNFLLQEEKYVNQSIQNNVRCVLCLNKVKEFKNMNCKKHIICTACSSSNQNLDELCYCSNEFQNSLIFQSNVQNVQQHQ